MLPIAGAQHERVGLSKACMPDWLGVFLYSLACAFTDSPCS